ncbi:hypothetical protein [Gordonia sp. (in: high G+C Gram-positive bacteria)]|uniref:hypothetical protein n=1 Tax=Gordonia sp. (in: high G+C Gram-positive bacteria) TaxID=84139 RepID=UPI0039E316AE
MRKTSMAAGIASLAVAAAVASTGGAAATSYVQASIVGFDMTVYPASGAQIAFKAFNQTDRDITCGWTVDGFNQPAYEIPKGSKGVGSVKSSYGAHKIAILCKSYQDSTLVAPKYKVQGSGTITVKKDVPPPPPKPPAKEKLPQKPIKIVPKNKPGTPNPAPADPITQYFRDMGLS